MSAIGAVALDDIRDSLEGGVPAVVATCAPDGTPNVCYLSQVEYVDAQHVALSFQFFNKTRHNILANPWATVAVVDPFSAALHRLRLHYLRTETSGAVFERMRAKLASIASATGTTAVFRLRGSDIYRVESIEAATEPVLPKTPRPNRLGVVRACSDALSGCRELGALLESWLDGLRVHFGIEHAMVLALDASQQRFFTLASRGYADAGVGSEIPLGAGTVGMAASQRTPIRLSHASSDYTYVRAIRDAALRDPRTQDRIEAAIDFPGLAEPSSQMSVPIEAGDRLLGVLHVESAQAMRFSHADEDALVVLARQVGQAMAALDDEEAPADTPAPAAPAAADVPPLVMRRLARNHSIFLGDDYLIKGVAGAILWKLACAHRDHGREHFSNRELRADAQLGLPETGREPGSAAGAAGAPAG